MNRATAVATQGVDLESAAPSFSATIDAVALTQLHIDRGTILLDLWRYDVWLFYLGGNNY